MLLKFSELEIQQMNPPNIHPLVPRLGSRSTATMPTTMGIHVFSPPNEYKDMNNICECMCL